MTANSVPVIRASEPARRRRSESRQYFDAVAHAWDSRHGPGSNRGTEFAVRIRYLRALCRAIGRPRVLDLGCGTGRTLLHLSDVIAAGVGVDISPAMIAQARHNAADKHLGFELGDAADFCNECRRRFDLVLLIGTIEHVPAQRAVLAGAARVLAADGRLVVISPHPWNPLFRAKHFLEAGYRSAPADHLSPSRLLRLAGREAFELHAMRALPYAAWSPLGSAFCDRAGAAGRPIRWPAFVGLLRGAFAAEFGHRG